MPLVLGTLCCIKRGLSGRVVGEVHVLCICIYPHCNIVLTCSGNPRLFRHIRMKYTKRDVCSLTFTSICGDSCELRFFALFRPADEWASIYMLADQTHLDRLKKKQNTKRISTTLYIYHISIKYCNSRLKKKRGRLESILSKPFIKG
jgi:hypothetical protein